MASEEKEMGELERELLELQNQVQTYYLEHPDKRSEYPDKIFVKSVEELEEKITEHIPKKVVEDEIVEKRIIDKTIAGGENPLDFSLMNELGIPKQYVNSVFQADEEEIEEDVDDKRQRESEHMGDQGGEHGAGLSGSLKDYFEQFTTNDAENQSGGADGAQGGISAEAGRGAGGSAGVSAEEKEAAEQNIPVENPALTNMWKNRVFTGGSGADGGLFGFGDDFGNSNSGSSQPPDLSESSEPSDSQEDADELFRRLLQESSVDWDVAGDGDALSPQQSTPQSEMPAASGNSMIPKSGGSESIMQTAGAQSSGVSDLSESFNIDYENSEQGNGGTKSQGQQGDSYNNRVFNIKWEETDEKTPDQEDLGPAMEYFSEKDSNEENDNEIIRLTQSDKEEGKHLHAGSGDTPEDGESDGESEESKNKDHSPEIETKIVKTQRSDNTKSTIPEETEEAGDSAGRTEEANMSSEPEMGGFLEGKSGTGATPSENDGSGAMIKPQEEGQLGTSGRNDQTSEATMAERGELKEGKISFSSSDEYQGGSGSDIGNKAPEMSFGSGQEEVTGGMSGVESAGESSTTSAEGTEEGQADGIDPGDELPQETYDDGMSDGDTSSESDLEGLLNSLGAIESQEPNVENGGDSNTQTTEGKSGQSGEVSLAESLMSELQDPGSGHLESPTQQENGNNGEDNSTNESGRAEDEGASLKSGHSVLSDPAVGGSGGSGQVNEPAAEEQFGTEGQNLGESSTDNSLPDYFAGSSEQSEQAGDRGKPSESGREELTAGNNKNGMNESAKSSISIKDGGQGQNPEVSEESPETESGIGGRKHIEAAIIPQSTIQIEEEDQAEQPESTGGSGTNSHVGGSQGQKLTKREKREQRRQRLVERMMQEEHQQHQSGERSVGGESQYNGDHEDNQDGQEALSSVVIASGEENEGDGSYQAEEKQNVAGSGAAGAVLPANGRRTADNNVADKAAADKWGTSRNDEIGKPGLTQKAATSLEGNEEATKVDSDTADTSHRADKGSESRSDESAEKDSRIKTPQGAFGMGAADSVKPGFAGETAGAAEERHQTDNYKEKTGDSGKTSDSNESGLSGEADKEVSGSDRATDGRMAGSAHEGSRKEPSIRSAIRNKDIEGTSNKEIETPVENSHKAKPAELSRAEKRTEKIRKILQKDPSMRKVMRIRGDGDHKGTGQPDELQHGTKETRTDNAERQSEKIRTGLRKEPTVRKVVHNRKITTSQNGDTGRPIESQSPENRVEAPGTESRVEEKLKAVVKETPAREQAGTRPYPKEAPVKKGPLDPETARRQEMERAIQEKLNAKKSQNELEAERERNRETEMFAEQLRMLLQAPSQSEQPARAKEISKPVNEAPVENASHAKDVKEEIKEEKAESSKPSEGGTNEVEAGKKDGSSEKEPAAPTSTVTGVQTSAASELEALASAISMPIISAGTGAGTSASSDTPSLAAVLSGNPSEEDVSAGAASMAMVSPDTPSEVATATAKAEAKPESSEKSSKKLSKREKQRLRDLERKKVKQEQQEKSQIPVAGEQIPQLEIEKLDKGINVDSNETAKASAAQVSEETVANADSVTGAIFDKNGPGNSGSDEGSGSAKQLSKREKQRLRKLEKQKIKNERAEKEKVQVAGEAVPIAGKKIAVEDKKEPEKKEAALENPPAKLKGLSPKEKKPSFWKMLLEKISKLFRPSRKQPKADAVPALESYETHQGVQVEYADGMVNTLEGVVEGAVRGESIILEIRSVIKSDVVVTDCFYCKQKSNVFGNVYAKKAIVEGTVTGDVQALQSVEIREGGCVLGNVQSPVIRLDVKGYVAGNLTYEKGDKK